VYRIVVAAAPGSAQSLVVTPGHRSAVASAGRGTQASVVPGVLVHGTAVPSAPGTTNSTGKVMLMLSTTRSTQQLSASGWVRHAAPAGLAMPLKRAQCCSSPPGPVMLVGHTRCIAATSAAVGVKADRGEAPATVSATRLVWIVIGAVGALGGIPSPMASGVQPCPIITRSHETGAAAVSWARYLAPTAAPTAPEATHCGYPEHPQLATARFESVRL